MSKELEAFEDIKTVMTKLFGGVERADKALMIVEKGLKALEIIREKLIDVGRLYGCMLAYPHEKTPIYYNEKIDKRYKTYMLTQEEFDLLREVL